MGGIFHQVHSCHDIWTFIFMLPWWGPVKSCLPIVNMSNTYWNYFAKVRIINCFLTHKHFLLDCIRLYLSSEWFHSWHSAVNPAAEATIKFNMLSRKQIFLIFSNFTLNWCPRCVINIKSQEDLVLENQSSKLEIFRMFIHYHSNVYSSAACPIEFHYILWPWITNLSKTREKK